MADMDGHPTTTCFHPHPDTQGKLNVQSSSSSQPSSVARLLIHASQRLTIIFTGCAYYCRGFYSVVVPSGDPTTVPRFDHVNDTLNSHEERFIKSTIEQKSRGC